ncbi:2OG-Fe(II) oxygenase [Streptomyces sp. NPDC046727]|uniref:2OG-Fe(II) oxygenase n=1 Tax=Streptomyces sp. NPDC046727 TaxID=3155373 RepID=UPI0033D0073E
MRTDTHPRAERSEVQPLKVWRGALSLPDCRGVVEAMARSATVAGPVLRRSCDMVDARVRSCAEHQAGPDEVRPVLAAMRAVAGQAVGGTGWPRMALDGPKLCSYSARGFFRAHRDRSEDPLDPAVVRNRRLSLVCLLNDVAPRDGLPSFDGGALVVYLPRPDGSVSPHTVRLDAGSIVTFRSDLLHEVRPVRAGVRYSAVGWLYDLDDTDEEDGRCPISTVS